MYRGQSGMWAWLLHLRSLESPCLLSLILTHILQLDSVKRPLRPMQSLTVSQSHL